MLYSPPFSLFFYRIIQTCRLLMLTLTLCCLPHVAQAIEEMEPLTEAEITDAQQIMRWPEMRYNNTLSHKTIEEIYSENLLAGEFNTEGYILRTSHCLSPCSEKTVCMALCANGLIISSTPNERNPFPSGHDIKAPHEMILFIYARGREKVPTLDNFVIGQKYRFSLSKDPYQAELLGYEIIK